MITYFEKRQNSLSYRVLSAIIAFTFISNLVLPPGYAQTVTGPGLSLLNLPTPGTMVTPTAGFTPALMTGVTIHPDNPLRFDFIMDRGQSGLSGEPLKTEYQKMIKYFMASLTVPEKELWVNLSPYEKDRMIAEGLGQTEMGRDMLAQDYLLKQLTASLMYPEKELGKKFWEKIYKEAREKYGTTQIPVNTFNKVWIVPDEALVYEQESSAFVIKSRLRVMLEEDYEAMQHETKDQRLKTKDFQSNEEKSSVVSLQSSVSSEIIKEIILPAIEKEVNEGENFANLRQIYNALILATWYKQRLEDSLLGKVYVDQNKTKGIDTQDKEINQKIYGQYIESFKKGVYNFIKEDVDPATDEIVPRKYFSGGMAWKLGGLKTVGALAFGTLLSFGSPDFGNASALAAVAMGGNKDGVTTEFVDNADQKDIGTAIVVKEGAVQPVLLTGMMKKLVEEKKLRQEELQKFYEEMGGDWGLRQQEQYRKTHERLRVLSTAEVINVIRQEGYPTLGVGADILAERKDRSTVKPLMELYREYLPTEAGKEEPFYARADLVSAIGRIGGDEAKRFLQETVKNDPSPTVRDVAKQQLLRLSSEPASSPVVVTKQDVHTWSGFDDLKIDETIKITVKPSGKDLEKRVPVAEVGHIKQTVPSSSWHRLKQELTNDVYIVELKSGTGKNNLLFNIGSDTDGLSWISVFRSNDGENYEFVSKNNNKSQAINVTEAMKTLTFRVFEGEKRIEVTVSRRWFDLLKGIKERKLIADTELETFSGYRVDFKLASSPVSKEEGARRIDNLFDVLREMGGFRVPEVVTGWMEAAGIDFARYAEGGKIYDNESFNAGENISLWLGGGSRAVVMTKDNLQKMTSDLIERDPDTAGNFLEELEAAAAHFQARASVRDRMDSLVEQQEELERKIDSTRGVIIGIEDEIREKEGRIKELSPKEREELQMKKDDWKKALAEMSGLVADLRDIERNLAEIREQSEPSASSPVSREEILWSVKSVLGQYSHEKVLSDVKSVLLYSNFVPMPEDIQETMTLAALYIKADKEFGERLAGRFMSPGSFGPADKYFTPEELNKMVTVKDVIDIVMEKKKNEASASSPVSSSVSEERVPTAARLVGMGAAKSEDVGGIDFNPALLDLQIKRDANGVPLPLPQQPIGTMHIDGFLPVIINITPLTNLPMLLGLADTRQGPEAVYREGLSSMDRKSNLKARDPQEVSLLN